MPATPLHIVSLLLWVASDDASRKALVPLWTAWPTATYLPSAKPSRRSTSERGREAYRRADRTEKVQKCISIATAAVVTPWSGA